MTAWPRHDHAGFGHQPEPERPLVHDAGGHGRPRHVAAVPIVPDCAPVWASAQAAGAEVVMDLQDMSYGGKAFTVRDLEGYLWSVGEYDPWLAREAAVAG